MNNMINERRNMIKILGLGIYDYNSMVTAYNAMHTSKATIIQPYNTLFKECMNKVRTLCLTVNIELEDTECDEPKTELGKLIYKMEEREMNFDFDSKNCGFNEVKKASYFIYVEKQTIKLFTEVINILSQNIDCVEFEEASNKINIAIKCFYRNILNHYVNGIINPYMVVKNYIDKLKENPQMSIMEFITYTHSIFNIELPNPTILGKNAVVDYRIMEQVIKVVMLPHYKPQSYEYIYYQYASQYNIEPMKCPLAPFKFMLDKECTLKDLLSVIHHQLGCLETNYLAKKHGLQVF